MTERARFPIVLTVATAISLAVLLSLGTWQLQRLQWKEGVIRRIAALDAAAARAAGPVLDAGGDMEFTRVVVSCPGLAKAPYVELYTLRNGQAGSRLISACPSPSARYRTLLVDRGFVADTISARPPLDAADRTPTSVTGVLRTGDPANAFTPANRPDRWFSRDPAGMAAALRAPAPAAPVFLMAETSSNPEWQALVPAPVPKDISNNHLGYAITWYGLALALAGVYAAMLLKRRKD